MRHVNTLSIGSNPDSNPENHGLRFFGVRPWLQQPFSCLIDGTYDQGGCLIRIFPGRTLAVWKLRVLKPLYPRAEKISSAQSGNS
jgi:hypothetical protein